MAGDEDLGGGSLQAMFDDYESRCAFVKRKEQNSN